MSLIILVAANAVALAIAWQLELSIGSLVFVYWLQSVVIGAMQVIRIARLRRFVPDLGARHPPVSDSAAIKIWIAVFFSVHYGLFHLVYLIFILVAVSGDAGGDVGEPLAILACLAGFLLHHALALRQGLKSDADGLPSLKGLMWQPYPRIIPMHVMILTGVLFWGGAGPEALLIFGALKTLADALMHVAEHRQRNSVPST